MDRALILQDGIYISGKFEVRGNYVIVFTDETRIHQHYSPLTSWSKYGTTGKATSKGKRLAVRVGLGVMCPLQHAWLGSVSFCIKQSVFRFALVCCVLCELCESVSNFECCRS
jgi:hypothetical protein